MIIPINVNLCFCDRLGPAPKSDSTDKMGGFFDNPYQQTLTRDFDGNQTK